jgi:hypothetical protein
MNSLWAREKIYRLQLRFSSKQRLKALNWQVENSNANFKEVSQENYAWLAVFRTFPSAISRSATTTSRLSESSKGFAPFKQLPCPLRSKHHQLKAVVNFLQAIFNRDSRHESLLQVD